MYLLTKTICNNALALSEQNRTPSQQAGLSRQTMINYEAGRTTPSSLHLKKIAMVAAVSVGWLLGSDEEVPSGGFLLPPADAALPAIPILSEGRAGEIGEEPLQLNLLPEAHVRSGLPRDGFESPPDDGQEDWLTRPADVRDLTAYCLRVSSDSMSPQLQEGQLVIVSPIKQVYPGDLAVVKIYNQALRIMAVDFLDGKIILRADITREPEHAIGPQEIEFMHKIVWVKM